MIRITSLLVSLALVTVAATALTGCATDTSLENTSWRLVGWTTDAPDPAEFDITLEFEQDQLGGKAPVNSYGGPYTTSGGDRFSIGDIHSTLMAGTPEQDRAERAYFELLDAAERYSLDGDTLTLQDSEGNDLLVFERAN